MDSIYSYLSGKNYCESYSMLPLDIKHRYSEYCPLNKLTQEAVKSSINSSYSNSTNGDLLARYYFLYHVEQEDLRINAVGIANPSKVQGYMHLYAPLISASIARIIKLNSTQSNWHILLFTDSKTRLFIEHFINESFPSAKTSISYIVVNDDGTRYPMWYRFHIFKYAIMQILYLHLAQAEVYCIDSDYVPSKWLDNLSPFLNDSDIVFTTNADSFPLWQINEGVYAVKVTHKAAYFFNYCSYIYEALYLDNTVRESWKDPRIWRGAQAALMLSSFKFNDTYRAQQNCKLDLKIDDTSIRVRRYPGKFLNSPPNELFDSEIWCINESAGYHFTGNHKYHQKLNKFIEYCKSIGG